MPPPLLGAATPWPAIVVGVAVVVAVSLWGMLREGSIAHRARGDERADSGPADDPPRRRGAHDEQGPPPPAEGHDGGDLTPPGPRP